MLEMIVTSYNDA